MSVPTPGWGLALLPLLVACGQSYAPVATEDRPLEVVQPDTQPAQQPYPVEHQDRVDATPQRVVAVVSPVGDSKVRGTVTFERAQDGVKVKADLEGLSPGPHGFHIHERGDCSGPGAETAGAHFDPEDLPHGPPGSPAHHAGDLGNLVADEQGRAQYELITREVAFEGDHSVIGRAVIVHSGEDDMSSQPSGDAGDRVGCGVIERGPGS